MEKILITGGCGFIGFSIAKELSKKGGRILLCDNLSRGKLDAEIKQFLGEYNNIEFVQLDLLNKDDLFSKINSDFDFVYHLAAIVGVKYTDEDPLRVLKTNIISTLNILEWAAQAKPGKLIFSSTSEVYAGGVHMDPSFPIPTPEDVPLIISDITNGRFTYAASKILGEIMTINYAKKYDLNYSIVRYHNVYGPRMGCEHVVPELILRIVKREDPFRLYSADQTRAFCYIDDAVNATIKVAQANDISSKIFHIGNDKEEIKIKELCNKLFEIADFYPVINALDPPKGSVERRCPNISKLRNITGYEPEVNLDTGLRKTYAWYKKYFEKS